MRRRFTISRRLFWTWAVLTSLWIGVTIGTELATPLPKLHDYEVRPEECAGMNQAECMNVLRGGGKNPKLASAPTRAQKEVDEEGNLWFGKKRVTTIKGLKIYICPQDHAPFHFHVDCKQEKFDARFLLYTAEFLSMKYGTIRNRDIRIIKKMFEEDREARKSLLKAFKDMNPTINV